MMLHVLDLLENHSAHYVNILRLETLTRLMSIEIERVFHTFHSVGMR